MFKIILVELILLSINIVADSHIGAIISNAEENTTTINHRGVKKDIKNHRRYRNFNDNHNRHRYRPIYIDDRYIIRDNCYRGYTPSNDRIYINNGFFFDADDIRGDRYIRERNYMRNRVIDRGRIIYYRFSNKKHRGSKHSIKRDNRK